MQKIGGKIMGKEEFVKEITNIEDDFAQWYTDVVRKAELADYTDRDLCLRQCLACA